MVERQMLYWALLVMLIAAGAGIVGFSGVVAAAGTAVAISKMIFLVFMVLLVIMLASHLLSNTR